MNDLFDIEKFNVISDDENYYFFRSLEPGDIEDIENGVIITENGYLRLRTDRERWEENHNGKADYSKDSQVSLEEMYNHIKYGYSLQTNCISLTSNPYVAKMYGEQFSQNYVMITVPKKEMGENVFLAGSYMLGEVQKKIDEYLANNEVDSSVLEDLEKVEHATDSSQIKKLIETRYKSEQPIDTRKSSMRKDVTYSAPHSRISSWQALNEEQNLAKNKIIGKLTILELKGKMPKILKKSKDNRKLIINIGGSFSSAEQIHYGDIEGENVQNISTEMLDMFGLLQQAESQDRKLAKELESELIRAVKAGKQLEISGESPLNRKYEVKSDISIEEMFKLTEGRVDYIKANYVVQKMFYLSRSRLYAIEFAKGLNQLTGNNPKYKEIIDYIGKNGFNIETVIFNRSTNGGVKVAGTVNLSLNENEKVLAEEIKSLNQDEYIEILEKGGLSNVGDIVTRTFSTMQTEKMSRERYYAEAIVDSYNWEEISQNGLNEDARKELIEKLQKYDIVKIYQKLKEAGIEEKDISKYVLNIVTRENLVNAKDFSKMLEENEELLQRKLSVEQIDRFLGYYDVKETKLKLRDYQQDAFDKSKELLSKRRFASVVMPTGGGKSFVSIAHILEHKDEKMLYLAPDDEILNQMMDYIIQNVEGLSKTSEKKSKREIIKEKLNIEFETYPGLMAKRNKDLLKEQFDFIVLDELHRTGADKWEKKLDKLLENQKEEAKVLGITATPTRDVDGRDMSKEVAEKLGYTKEETHSTVNNGRGAHSAYYMDLDEAIKLGRVVNPKIVSCEYTLKVDGSMERLKEKIEAIKDGKVKAEKLEKFNELSRSLEKAEGIPEILQKYVKPGQKYIVFLPATAIETDDDKKIGEAKIKEYETKLEEYFKGSKITPEFYSMLGAYGGDKNEAQLKGFETSSSPDTKFMVVINKAKEGLHIAGLNGMVWFRPLDENSYILYHQQLGRVIYSIDKDNPPKDEDRPIVIDLANNTFRVRMDKEVNTYTKKSDYDLLCAVVDWVQKHNGGVLPDVESSSKQEKRYSATLYRLQNKYMKYFDDENFEGLTQEEREEIQAILDKGFEIDLWDAELFPPIPEEKIDEILRVDAFEVSGVMKDYVELEEEVNFENSKTPFAKTLEIARVLYENGVDLSPSKLRTGRKVKYDDGSSTTINLKLSEMSQKGIDFEKIIEENGLNSDFPFGQNIKQIRRACYGSSTDRKITDEEKKEAERIGIIKDERAEAFEIFEILFDSGIDFSNFQFSKRISGGDRHYTLLSEIEQEGIDIKAIIEENDLDPNYEIASKLRKYINIYNGNEKAKKDLSEDEKEKLEKWGIVAPNRDKRHPYLILVETTIPDWLEENNSKKLPKTFKSPKTEKEEKEDKLARQISNLKKYIKKRMAQDAPLTEEEKEIIEKAERLGIMVKKKNPNMVIIDDIKSWRRKNDSEVNPIARASERNKPKSERSEEYSLGKRRENLENAFLKKYKDMSYEEFLELPKDIKEIIIESAKLDIGSKKFNLIRLLREKMGLHNPEKLKGQSLGQAGFGSPVEECDKAQADLARRVEELESAKGVMQDE